MVTAEHPGMVEYNVVGARMTLSAAHENSHSSCGRVQEDENVSDRMWCKVES